MIIQELRAEFNEYFQSPDAELILKTTGSPIKGQVKKKTPLL